MKERNKGKIKNNFWVATSRPKTVDAKAKDRLCSPLHLAAYLLNLDNYYRDNEVVKNPRLMDAIHTCVENSFTTFGANHQVVNMEFSKYIDASGLFGK